MSGVECYRVVRAREVLHFISCFLLGGIPYLILDRWRPSWKIRLISIKTRVPSDYVILENSEIHKVCYEEVSGRRQFPTEWIWSPGDQDEPETEDPNSRLLSDPPCYFAHFEHKKLRYAYNSRRDKFIPVEYGGVLRKNPLSPSERADSLMIYGPNIAELKVPSYLKLLVEEVLHPFYVFQIGSIILWSLDEYLFYAACIFIISAFSVGVSLVETRRQSETLRDITKHRSEDGETNDPSHLVPGDIVIIRDNQVMPCDAAIISGSVLVNESMLTGESVPVIKTELPRPTEYDTDKHRGHTLYSGTKILQTRNHSGVDKTTEAVVVRTGFSTAKGELVRSILYPRPVNFKFYRDSIKFIGVLFGIASIGMAYCIYIMRHRSLGTLVLRCLDIITVAVPPALPAAMTVGSFYAQNRLKKDNKIFCIAPQRINVGGKLKLVCFDKTGTLTEDGLNFDGVASADEKKDTWKKVENIPNPEIKWCLASCHALTLVNGELTGDPLDIKMFEATGWSLEEPAEDDHVKYDMLTPTIVRPKNNRPLKNQNNEIDELQCRLEDLEEIGIIRQFPFNSEVARMSVIVRRIGDEYFRAFVKGAPEKIIALCNSTPPGFNERLKSLTLRGLRVIALATKNLTETSWRKVQKLTRESVESELCFIGFLIMRNNLKPQTRPVIDTLRRADIRCVMVTGDNILTALSVARESGLIDKSDKVLRVEASETTFSITPSLVQEERDDASNGGPALLDDTVSINIDGKRSNFHFAIDGKTWRNLRLYFPQWLHRFVEKGTVFARMDPEQKAQLIEEAIKLDYVVGMCGDGANDCGALKAAHVGISLSDAEASVAAPFTSAIPNITCVPAVIREGRCSLVTSFGLFKYMALYSLIQFISVLILYSVHCNLGDTQYLYIDLVITTTVAVLMSWTKPFTILGRKRPSGSLISGTNLFSIFGQVIVAVCVQLGAYVYLTKSSWFKPVNPDTDEESTLSWETTTIFFVSSFQYLILAAAFSKGPPFRRPFYSNLYFLLALLFLNVLTTVLGLYPGAFLARILELMFDPTDLKFRFRLTLLAFVIFNYTVSFFIEGILAESRFVKKLSHKLTGKSAPKNYFKRIRRAIEEENWPSFEGVEVKATQEEECLRTPGVS